MIFSTKQHSLPPYRRLAAHELPGVERTAVFYIDSFEIVAATKYAPIDFLERAGKRDFFDPTVLKTVLSEHSTPFGIPMLASFVHP